MILVVGVNSDGLREVLGMDIGSSETEAFWTVAWRRLIVTAPPLSSDHLDRENTGPALQIG